MPRKKATTSGKGTAQTEPKFPYTTKPSSLRRLLREIPTKPRPAKFDGALLKSWGFHDTNDYTMIRVLKAVELLDANSQPTDLYSRYMVREGGAAALAEPVKKVYGPLFNASHAPYSESNETLKNLFNIHSGGSARVLEFQIQTFKALCENTSFEAVTPSQLTVTTPGAPSSGGISPPSSNPAIHVDLHIHLPENKSSREYETIIQDIGRYIFGRTDSNSVVK